MQLTRDALLFVHFLGLASLLGGAAVQMRDEVQVVNSAMLHGALLTVASGLLLVGVIEGMGGDVDHLKISVKLAVALVVTLLCWVNRRKEGVPAGLFMAILGLTVANVAVAVFW